MMCPWCGGSRQRVVVHAEQWKVISCTECLNAWTDPPPAEKPYEEDDFHGQFAFKEVADLPRQWRAALEGQVQLIRQFVPAGAKVLEIGCGEGFLLGLLSARKYVVTGVEPSAAASARARTKGLNVFTGYFPNGAVDGTYDAIILSQVVEHLKDPRNVLLEAQKKLKEEGVLLLVQANWRGLVPRVLKERWYAWVPEQHYWHFTGTGMAHILRTLGFDLLALRYSSLEHGDDMLSRIASLIPRGGDQFHLLARVQHRDRTV